MTAEDRFWSRVVRLGPDECWEWTGARTQGYGRLTPERGLRASVPAHRFSYELLVGPIPAGLVIDHLCRNHACVNPAHLEPVTNKENILRGHTPFARNAAKTHCLRGHALTPDNLVPYVARKRGRACLECSRIHNRNRRRRAADRRAAARAALDELG